MRLEIKDDGTIHMFLSKRNLLALLTKLNHPTSACALECSDITGRVIMRVISEPNEVHYAHPDRLGVPPGTMIHWTEEDIQQIDALEK